MIGFVLLFLIITDINNLFNDQINIDRLRFFFCSIIIMTYTQLLNACNLFRLGFETSIINFKIKNVCNK